jgi:hypothetical protein
MALSICTQLLLTDRCRTPQPGGLASLRTGELGQAGDSARMDARRYPSFADVYANYFHEDWRHDDVSAVGVVKRYLRVAPPEEVYRIADELTSLLAAHRPEEVLMADLGPFTNYDPAEDGLTVEQ